MVGFTSALRAGISQVHFDSVAIVGGGLTGLGIAHSLAPVSKSIALYDLEPGPGINGASAVSVMKNRMILIILS